MGEAAYGYALTQLDPAVVRSQRGDYRLQCQAVQGVAWLCGNGCVWHDCILSRHFNHSTRQLEYAPRKRGRVVDCTGLENRRRETVREFESHRFRHFIVWR